MHNTRIPSKNRVCVAWSTGYKWLFVEILLCGVDYFTAPNWVNGSLISNSKYQTCLIFTIPRWDSTVAVSNRTLWTFTDDVDKQNRLTQPSGEERLECDWTNLPPMTFQQTNQICSCVFLVTNNLACRCALRRLMWLLPKPLPPQKSLQSHFLFFFQR